MSRAGVVLCGRTFDSLSRGRGLAFHLVLFLARLPGANRTQLAEMVKSKMSN